MFDIQVKGWRTLIFFNEFNLYSATYRREKTMEKRSSFYIFKIAFGFFAKPVKGADNNLNLNVWSVGIPGS